MIGAIIGDIVGSRWEFNPTNDYNFEWLSEENGFTDDTICTKTISSLLVFNEKPVEENPCIRCGSCVLSCPAYLEPVSIMNAVKAVNKEGVKSLHPERCIECGLCTYSCTSGIRVTDYVRRAKIIAKL